MSQQMCLNCQVNPAVPNDGTTVALCAGCKGQATNPRGVTVEPRRTKKPRRAARR